MVILGMLDFVPNVSGANLSALRALRAVRPLRLIQRVPALKTCTVVLLQAIQLLPPFLPPSLSVSLYLSINQSLALSLSLHLFVCLPVCRALTSRSHTHTRQCTLLPRGTEGFAFPSAITMDMHHRATQDTLQNEF